MIHTDTHLRGTIEVQSTLGLLHCIVFPNLVVELTVQHC